MQRARGLSQKQPWLQWTLVEKRGNRKRESSSLEGHSRANNLAILYPPMKWVTTLFASPVNPIFAGGLDADQIW